MGEVGGTILAFLWLFAFIMAIVYVLSPLVIMSQLGKLNRQMDDVIHELRRANPLTKKL